MILKSGNTDCEMSAKEKFKRILIWGLLWGMTMFIIMGVMVPISEEEVLQLKPALLDLLYWTLSGFVMGWVIIWIEGLSKKK